MPGHMQIGEVADRTGLSLRTIRYYHEVGLVTPSARTAGNFRLYTDDDVARLLLIKRMKPLEFTLEEMRDLLAVVDALEAVEHPADAQELLGRLAGYRDAADERVVKLRSQLAFAEGFAADLRNEIARQEDALGRRGAGTG